VIATARPSPTAPTSPRSWRSETGSWCGAKRARHHFQDEVKCLGIEASPSFVRQPEGNGVAEGFIRTLKENLLWVRASHSPGATMKLGSSRGMDTKRPRGPERSKPCHKLQLTRRSPPPYPWPPEQAQSGVSKPYRTTSQDSGGSRTRGRACVRSPPPRQIAQRHSRHRIQDRRRDRNETRRREGRGGAGHRHVRISHPLHAYASGMFVNYWYCVDG
jgi:hypothetical protein